MYLKRLKELRVDRDLKQEKIAMLLGMKQQQYSRYEKLAQFYDVSIDYIAELTDQPTSYFHKKSS